MRALWFAVKVALNHITTQPAEYIYLLFVSNYSVCISLLSTLEQSLPPD